MSMKVLPALCCKSRLFSLPHRDSLHRCRKHLHAASMHHTALSLCPCERRRDAIPGILTVCSVPIYSEMEPVDIGTSDTEIAVARPPQTHLNQLTEHVDARNEFVELFVTFYLQFGQAIDLCAEIVCRIENNVVNAARTDDDVQEIE